MDTAQHIFDICGGCELVALKITALILTLAAAYKIIAHEIKRLFGKDDEEDDEDETK